MQLTTATASSMGALEVFRAYALTEDEWDPASLIPNTASSPLATSATLKDRFAYRNPKTERSAKYKVTPRRGGMLNGPLAR